MQIEWMIGLLLAGVSYASGNPCESSRAASCYADLVHYESLAFPLYGQDDAKLDETCSNINESFECIESYIETCFNRSDCDDSCQDLIRDSNAFTRTTGLRHLAEELCSEFSAVRAIYLENYQCLESNADAYGACHNDSQMSQEYMNTIEGPEIIPTRCCFFTWYHDCFANITRDHCGENARFFVSFAMHKLVGHVSDQLCMAANISCTRPPLPPPDDDEFEELDKDKPDLTDNDLDNSINDLSKGSATTKSFTLGAILFSYCFIVMSKRILYI